MAEKTSYFNKLWLHATANTAAPTIPALGANIASWDTAIAVGSRDAGDDADLDGDTIQLTFFNERGEVMAPRSQTRGDIITFANGLDEFSCRCYDMSQTLLDLASDWVSTSNVITPSTTTTKRAAVLEITGLAYIYIPNVAIYIPTISGSYTGDKGSVAKPNLIGKACKGDGINSGIQVKFYEAA